MNPPAKRRTEVNRSSRLRGFAAAIILATLLAPTTLAGQPVDPDTLIPPPFPGATCTAGGAYVICDTSFEIHLVNEPIVDFALPCGTIYETVDDVRRGIRWYDRDDLTIVKRSVFGDAEGSWSLSPTGDGPTVTLVSHSNWTNVDFPDPFDESTWATTTHGTGLTILAPGIGVILHFAGLDLPDGTHRGALNGFVDDPEVAAELCAALGA
jgi:hypothetical protein